MKKLKALVLFVRWVLPRGGCSPRLYFSLLRVLLCGRQSIYQHFKSLRAASPRAPFKDFLGSLASVRVPGPGVGPAPVPARLLARLLRTIYLTEVAPRGEAFGTQADPVRGFVSHRHFSYGESLGASVDSRTENGDLG